MEKKRGEELVRRDVEKRLFKDIYIKRCSYLSGKRILKEQEVYNLVRDFFKEYLDLDYEFTEQELTDELNRVYLEEQARSRVDTLLKSVFRIQYADAGLSEEELRKILKEFEKIVNFLVLERPHHHILYRFFHKLFRRHEASQAGKAPRFNQELQVALEERTSPVAMASPVTAEQVKQEVKVASVDMSPPAESIPVEEENSALGEKPVVEEMKEEQIVEIKDWKDDGERKEAVPKSEWVHEPVIIVDDKSPVVEKKSVPKEKIAKGKAGEKKTQSHPNKTAKGKKESNGKKDDVKKKISTLMEKKKKDIETHTSMAPVVVVTEDKNVKSQISNHEPIVNNNVVTVVGDGIRKNPKERIGELLKKIDTAIVAGDMSAAKTGYNDMHLIYKNVSPEVKQEFFQQVHEAYKKIKAIK